MLSLNRTLHIERLGPRGEGLAPGPDGEIAAPYALPGETIVAEVDGRRARLVEVTAPSRDRIAPICRLFGACGGCAVQTLRHDAYVRWKEGLLADALRRAGLAAPREPLLDAHGQGRRRATFHVRATPAGLQVGFMTARSHEIVDVDACPILAPGLADAPRAAHVIARQLAAGGKPLDILVTQTLDGLDVDLRGHGPLNEDETRRLVAAALRLDLARLSNHGVVVAQARAPRVRHGEIDAAIAPGAFLQATQAGEDALTGEAVAALRNARRVADLFCGGGAFSLRLARFSSVRALDYEEAPLKALASAARENGLRAVKVEARDLFRRPLSAQELSEFDGLVFDPPRAGALEQARAVAASQIPVVVAVSCNAETFARDAAILTAGGYEIEKILPVDQFRYSPHLEIVARFRRRRKKKARRLLG
ncbi:class I SAM-dependent RNA methyltransferase [Methylocella sp.]|uniref:class I SAM-dependent RNA methyltransferase n=1 Tax=Methylocella sp. TaxID=1978226 RepID=UPI0035AFDCA6